MFTAAEVNWSPCALFFSTLRHFGPVSPVCQKICEFIYWPTLSREACAFAGSTGRIVKILTISRPIQSGQMRAVPG